jgi:hypothetical protein
MEENLPAGFRAQPSLNGAGTELVIAAPAGQGCIVAFLAAWCILWDGFTLLFIVLTLLGVRKPGVEPLQSGLLLSLFAGAGLVVTAITLKLAFARTSWIVGPHQIARRMTVPRLGWSRSHALLEPQGLEIRHGIWKSGRGSTDVLQVRTSGRAVKIREAQHTLPLDAPREQAAHQAAGERDWRALLCAAGGPPVASGPAVPVAPEIAILGRFFADQTGLPLEVIEERIPDPPSGD